MRTKPICAAALLAAAMCLSVPAAQAASHCGADYVISEGDTLSKIARRCGHSVAEIMQVNTDLDARRIRIGQRITLPGSGATEEAQAQDVSALETVSRKGEIVNGRWCALLETPEGQIYGLRSREIAFVNGISVAIEGKLMDGECGQDKTIFVSGLEALN